MARGTVAANEDCATTTVLPTKTVLPENGKHKLQHAPPSAIPDPFVMPSERGMDATAAGFDTEAFLDLLAEDVMRIQHAKLREILELHAGVEYLQRHGLNGRTDVESFRKCVPVVRYGDLEGDIMRLVNGETKAPIFTVDPISEFHFSSGTTGGKPKYIPGTERSFDEERRFFFKFLDASYRRAFPGFKEGKALSIAFAGKQLVTPSGLKAGAVTTNIYRSARFQNRERGPDDEMCAPDEAILCEDIKQGMYCHLLCALARAPEIVKVNGIFAVTVVAAARAIRQQWREIVEDIRTGTLNHEIITDPDLRAAVEKTLHPNPDLASKIQTECSKEDWEGIFPRLFPNAHFVQCILSGSMLQYAPALKYFAGRLPLVSAVYAGSEAGHMGLNPRMNCAPEEITYVPWVERTYFEFIPVDAGDGPGEAVQIVEACDLEVGREYEVVVTTITGLYRYRVGDVIRVTSFRNTLPVFAFVRRMNVILSVHSDKTDEEELQAVVDKAAALLKEAAAMELSDYTSTSDVSSVPGRYIIFWEMVDSSNLDDNVLQKCANTLDASFNYIYRRWRYKGQIAPLELCIVREGTFLKVMHVAVSKGTAPTQYKVPRCVKNQAQALDILKEGRIRSYHSTITPQSTGV